ncbi:hypothetical protein ACFL20_11170 [Spirochaetota bacterium]
MKSLSKILLSLYILFMLPAVILAQEVDPAKDDTTATIGTDEAIKDIEHDWSYKTKKIQYGGWITPAFIQDYRDDSEYLNSSVTTIRLWSKFYLWKHSFLHLRIKNTLIGYLSHEGYKLPDEVENQFDVDLAFLKMSFLDQKLRFYVGRKFYILGSGLVYNGRGDGTELNFYSTYVDFKVFLAYTGFLSLSSNKTNPFRLSTNDDIRNISEDSERVFTGGIVNFNIMNHNVYVLLVAQFDTGDEKPGIRSKYDSQYSGIGAKGSFPFNLTYNAEIVYESGFSYTETNQKKMISAVAGTFNLYYYLKHVFKKKTIFHELNPLIVAHYAFGTGDSDRTGYEDSRGNTAGLDQGFISFGTFMGGYGLRPVLGNIHIVRLGFALTPCYWTKIWYLQRMTFIFKYSAYIKDKKDGTINYGEFPGGSKFVGNGVDLTLRWKIMSDISIYINYGVFVPDSSHSGESPRHFAMEGISLHF